MQEKQSFLLDIYMLCEGHKAHFRKSKADEACEPKHMSEIIQIISEQYPFVRPTHDTKLQIGFVLKAYNYVKVRDHSSNKYFVIKK